MQGFNIGQFLGTGDNTNVQVGPIQGFDGSSTATITTKQIQKSLFRLPGKTAVRMRAFSS
jgi:hypothetical protein